MDKNTLRKVYLEKRRFLSQSEYERRNHLLYHRLIEFQQIHQFHCIHTFIPIKENKEPDTFPFIQYLWSNESNVEVITAISDLNSPILNHVQITEGTTFLENKWGIPEPQNSAPYPINKIDCVLVPMVVGSKTGHRIGYGKGYYDRFLQSCKDTTQFVGVTLGPLLEGDAFAGEFDIPMHSMITPFEVVEIK
ncbi:5-formyltetrahydrofolate cyclo-ligase [Marivirga tractuosa]|uniref:5-formyltetrahydrofolate cyclo-ligase n=1 Tax=Marivirga tractuosa (strain ATCC 23168 / DSM 4126 / NBRC 15989 / NCIMB 1408 / VKM B-1430 / H-43) TaxID=643867 RepID=E4TT82_MARTH|nr:5-formyltetrahydrofolate cyclo-ligase [Marivirga tractuosa]ADR21912.1 5-formyltetrahydrofolate cyclo-ligase [Marivirga tractuosa DSM 4126]BDD13629.1 5-formyltetrahydrofolate cyclo-ligase [Marivirga tractuosa]